jgi:hypothetical protein
MLSMKATYKYLIFGFALSLVLLSCEKESYNELLISFSNGIVLDRDDIVFYDSADCVFLLKDTISFDYITGPLGMQRVNFSVSLDKDTIYTGFVYPGDGNMSSPGTYLACYEPYHVFNSNILDVEYSIIPTPGDFDPRNDERIVSFCKKNGLLRHGITVTLDSVRLSAENDSCLITTITIMNHDNINYYLPDPEKMGSVHFSFFLGGLFLSVGGAYYHPSIDYNIRNLYKHQMRHLSILDANSKITHTYTAHYPVPFEKGLYRGRFRFGVFRSLTTVDIPLEQDDGWVWVGDKIISFRNLLIE